MNSSIETAHIIFTANPDTAAIALDEIRLAVSGLQFEKWIASGVGLLKVNESWTNLVDVLKTNPPIFCRHIFPVQVDFPLVFESNDFTEFSEHFRSIYPIFDINLRFSIQTRLFGKRIQFKPYNVNQYLSNVLISLGALLDVRQPVQVVSIVCKADHVYMGLSKAVENLSDWAGGKRRFKRDPAQISRAEFKLLEALEHFNISLPDTGNALDMGAAPGGWTRILSSYGLRVIAVDPANLSPKVSRTSQVVHVKKLVQDFFPTDEQFEVIVNDMRMDALDSSHLMIIAAESLKENRYAILTLKLPKRKMAYLSRKALQLLSTSYRVIGARQLFHNRNEITVALKRNQNLVAK